MTTVYQAGVRVLLKSDPARVGILNGKHIERKGRRRWLVAFRDGGDEWVPELALEIIQTSGSILMH